MMDRFDRQVRIAGWRQELFQQATVAVHGRSWPGCLVVWGLANLGIGQIAWIGRPEAETNVLANWILATPCPIPNCTIVDYPCAVEYGPELKWALDERPLSALLDCGEDPHEAALCQAYASKRGTPVWFGTTAEGGWIGTAPVAPSATAPPHAVTAMLVAALLIDLVREAICPLHLSRKPRLGRLDLVTPGSNRRGNVVLVGVGGIGVYGALLAAQAGFRLGLVDLDHVEESNLNRQGLFTPQDAAQRVPKAEAAEKALLRLFPRAQITSWVTRLDRSSKDRLTAFKPSILVSAVDNAATRLVLQALGQELGVPVVQGGTDLFAADCFTQEVGGPLLDAQMHGALSEAAVREQSQPRRHGTCAADPSYVVPGMMSGALIAHRMTQALELYHGLGPIRWRAGELPHEQRLPTPYEFDLDNCHIR